jgi:hypothetical protein
MLRVRMSSPTFSKNAKLYHYPFLLLTLQGAEVALAATATPPPLICSAASAL